MKVSCIIPVYNEAKRVEGVIEAMAKHPLIDEIIVVNDGSTDNSKEVLEKRHGIHLISYDKNRGKTFALMTGMKKAKNDLIMLIDSDLIGLKPEDFTALIRPVTSGQADMSISLRKNSLPSYRLMGLDFVSGERVFSRKIIGDLDMLTKLPCFGFEAFLNKKLIAQKLRLKVVNWANVITPRKSAKFGWWAGVKGDTKMILQIISTIGIIGIISQIYKMRKLRVK